MRCCAFAATRVKAEKSPALREISCVSVAGSPAPPINRRSRCWAVKMRSIVLPRWR